MKYELFEPVAKTYTDLHYDVFILDYRGFGKSEGSIVSQEQLFADVQTAYNQMLKVYDEIAAGELQNKVNRISEIHGVDVNVYDPEGNLRVSSQPYYYNKGLLSRKMEPLAYYKLTKLFLPKFFTFLVPA